MVVVIDLDVRISTLDELEYSYLIKGVMKLEK